MTSRKLKLWLKQGGAVTELEIAEAQGHDAAQGRERVERIEARLQRKPMTKKWGWR